MDEFRKYHPIINFTYFGSVITFSMMFVNPICLVISLFSAFVYSIMLNGKTKVKQNLMYMLPLIIISALMNPAFNHRGVTILCYFPNGNPMTLESVLYGVAAALMIASVICHFSCFNNIITSDKFMYLFGKIIPSLSLVFSMILRFIPKFGEQLKMVNNAQSGIGRDISGGNIIRRTKNGIKILSIMITWSFENSLDTIDSMKGRGYGLPGRTAFSNYSFDKRDLKVLLCILALIIYIVIGSVFGVLKFEYFPQIMIREISAYTISVYIAYMLLFIIPIMIEMWEVFRWKRLKSRI